MYIKRNNNGSLDLDFDFHSIFLKFLKETWMRMFNDAPLAKFLHRSVSIECYGRVLNVKLLQPTAIIGHTLDAVVTDHFTAFNAQLFQVGTVF